ncbi:MAG: BamA/TamA family outer membrane protein [Rikenellaceae bacterium]|nr:BamA/TamA family outer membrane protein [Rikenellaceae bacterium]
MRIISFYLLLIAQILIVSCSVTRKLPPEDYLLANNDIVIHENPEDRLSRSEKIKKSELSPYVKQKPNSRLLGLKVNAYIYNLSNPEKNNRINRWIRKIGDPPVVYDSTLAVKSADDMAVYLRSRGYLNSGVDFFTDTVGKKINVEYSVRTGTPYRIGDVRMIFQDRFLEPIILEDSVNTLIHTGDLFDVNTLQAERERITYYLKDLGYHDFTINNISYIADSVPEDMVINLRMLVRQHISGYDEEDRPILENNAVFRIRDVYIQPDYNASSSVRDRDYFRRLDTLEYRGVNFIYNNSLNVKPDVLLRAINLYPNYLYNQTDIRRAYDNLFNLGYFRNINIILSKVEEDTASVNVVTFIGDESGDFTKEKLLDYHITATPRPRQSYSIDMEGTTTSNYYGLSLTVGYQHRNIFRGIELFDISTTGGYEFMRSNTKKNSYEIGGAVGFTMPRFVTPFRVDRYNKQNNVKTRFDLSINLQNRPYYKRTLSSGSVGYSWTNNKNSSFIIRPIDVTLIKMHSVDNNFRDSIKNEFLRNSYTSQLLVGISGSYIYNNQVSGVNKNTFRVRANAESNGNLFNLIAHTFNNKKNDDNIYKLFGIQYAQYVRADVDASYRFVLGNSTNLVYRFYIGSIIPYGNSKLDNLPVDRRFYAGGPNSMRGWQARTLGPGGSLYDPQDDPYPMQYGNFKLETNLEFRFPIYNFFHGAFFTDIGNVWYTEGDDKDPLAVFKFDTFYKQLGVAGGFGLRLDFNFFIFRLDWGLRLHDPNKPKQYRWIQHLTLRQSSFNFGIGYPF